MKYDLDEFDRRVSLGLIRRVEKGDLVLYNYTDKCVYEKAWDDYTRVARGIIFEKSTGKLIAKPHPSGRNRQINNESFINERLEACKKYIEGFSSAKSSR